MESRKRKREDEKPRVSKKIICNQLSKRYRQPVRDISEVLMNGANLDVGHVVGTLDAIGRDGDTLTFEIKDDNDKILVCQFVAPHLVLDNNRTIEKPIELAIKAACRHSVDDPGNYKYPFKLLFDQFQFVLGGQLYMHATGWMDYSDDEEDSAPVPKHKQAPRTAPSVPVVQATNAVSYNNAASTSMAQKSDWTTLFDALKNHPPHNLTIAGIVKEVPYPPKQMGTRDWSMTVHLIDSTTTEKQFLEVKLYAKHKAHLPPLDNKDPKDVALLVSDVQIQVKGGRYVYATGNTCRYVCFAHGDEDPHVRDISGEPIDIFKSAPVYPWKDAELVELKRLMAWYRGEQMPTSLFQGPSAPRKSSNYKNKHKLIGDAKLDDYFDCTVELLSKYNGKDSSIYVTDFTVNELLKDPNSHKFSYPAGHRTLFIQLFDYPAEQVGSLEVGYIYRIKNVRLRGNNGYVKGFCGSFKNGRRNEIDIVESGDEHLESLKSRKRAYEIGGNDFHEPKSRPSKTSRTAATKPPESKNGQVEESECLPTDFSKSLSPSYPSSPGTEVPETSRGTAKPPKLASPPKPKIIKTYPEFPDLLLIEPSNLIRCKYPDKYPLSTLEEMKFSQVNPALFKFQGRIVDIEPGNLEESVVRFCTACKDDGANCSSCGLEDTVEYRPRIQITFQDATGEFPVKFGDDAAVKFFRLSKKARRNREILLNELSKCFQVLLGPSSGSKYQVGGVSEIFELVVRSWQIKVGVARPQGAGTTRWIKCLAPAGCWLAIEEQV